MKPNHKYTGPLSLTGAFLILIGSANAAVVFRDNFEPTGSGSNATSLLGSGNTANVTGYQQGAINNTLWVGSAAGFASERWGLIDESSGSFTDPTGTQGFAKRYTSNTGLTSAVSTIGSLTAGTIITLTFDAVLDGGGISGGNDIAAYLVLFNGGARDAVNPSGDYTGTSAVLAQALFTNDATSSYKTYTLTYTVGNSLIDNDGAGAGTSTAWNPALLGQDIGIRFGTGQSAIIDNVSLDISAIPEPSAAALAGLGVLLFVLRRRR